MASGIKCDNKNTKVDYWKEHCYPYASMYSTCEKWRFGHSAIEVNTDGITRHMANTLVV